MYMILSSDRVAYGARVRPSDVDATMDRFSPTSLSPGKWLSVPGAVDLVWTSLYFAGMARIGGGR